MIEDTCKVYGDLYDVKYQLYSLIETRCMETTNMFCNLSKLHAIYLIEKIYENKKPLTF